MQLSRKLIHLSARSVQVLYPLLSVRYAIRSRQGDRRMDAVQLAERSEARTKRPKFPGEGRTGDPDKTPFSFRSSSLQESVGSPESSLLARMESEEDKISFFQAVTGADHETAEHVLEAHGWDLNRGVNFYMESSSAPASTGVPSHAIRPEAPPPGYDSDEIVDLEDRPTVTSRPEAAAPIPLEDEDDDMLTAALTASLRTENGEDEAPPHTHRGIPQRNGWQSAGEEEMDSDYEPHQLGSLQEKGAMQRRTSGRSRIQRGLSVEDLPEGRVRRNRPRGAAAPDPILGFLAGNGVDHEGNGHAHPRQRFAEDVDEGAALDWPPPLLVDGRVPEDWMPGRSRNAQEGSDIPNMPDGINVEEARMLEAALLGIPYEGRIPDFTQHEAAEPAPPSVMQGRQLRQEQDQAYLDSLQADKIKADTAEAQRRAADEALRREEEARLSAVEAERDYQRELEEKASQVPAEPPADDTDAITVLIRGPSGQKFGRRFRRSDPFSSLFSYVDISGAPEFRAGQYKLVTQFPRRAFDGSKEGTLQDAGLAQKQEALFVELL